MGVQYGTVWIGFGSIMKLLLEDDGWNGSIFVGDLLLARLLPIK